MFIGRERELENLNKRYKSGKFECIPIYGRRRIGKTQLILEFVRDKKAIVYLAKKGDYSENMRTLSKAIYENETVSYFVDFEDALNKIYERAKKEKLVFVIDEYPYLAESKESVSSTLQHIIDHKFMQTDMILILCGSSMSFMENQVLGYQSPLYGRRSGQIKLKPLGYKKSALFCPNYSKADNAVVFGVTGGIPKYLSLFDPERTLEKNIIDLYFDKNSFLYEEPENLLKQELREPSAYNMIISAVATGASQMKDIIGKTGMESSAVSGYIKSLIELGIIKREVPIFDRQDSKKSIYRLSDGMFRFWYRFVFGNLSLIDYGKGGVVYENIAKQQIPTFMGEAFEQICIDYMWDNFEHLPFVMQNIGRWWGANPKTKTAQEIDFIAHDCENKKAAFGECKWTNEKTPESVVERLVEKADMFGNYQEKYYYLFSKSGFTEAAGKKASEHIKLIEFEDMF
ncbi:MAG: ATP-binding protein [Oscillospiraceae bacterium]|nr:ATP-binding protein [Oscillospiraceae bacterium]